MKFVHKNIFIVVMLAISMATISERAFAVADCITAWGGPGDPVCGITAVITPSSYNAPYNGSISVQFRAIGLFETYNDIHLFHAWVTGGMNSDIVNDTSSRTWSGGLGPLPSTVTLNLQVEDHQGATDYNSTVVSVAAAPPTVDIHFSFFDTAKEYMHAIIVASKRPDTYAVAEKAKAEGK